ncbi:MAG: hypothetical protein NTW32_07775 [Chloroflexi bacterium]|nr:hypothetical protein [Chloroflexota bacterium]
MAHAGQEFILQARGLCEIQVGTAQFGGAFGNTLFEQIMRILKRLFRPLALGDIAIALAATQPLPTFTEYSRTAMVYPTDFAFCRDNSKIET